MKRSEIGVSLAKPLVVVLLSTAMMFGQQYDSALSWNKGMKVPASNPLSAAKVALGKRLFFDTRLSIDEWLACASCHDPAHAFSEARRVSVGVLGQRGKRHAPTLLGRGLGESHFWDGRATTLEEQVLQPIINPDEMGMNMDAVLRRLNQDPAYRGLTQESLADALASYLRTIRSENSNYDLFVSGWPDMLSDLELDGLRLFRGKARCNLCHSGT